jgi:hypothetical protein
VLAVFRTKQGKIEATRCELDIWMRTLRMVKMPPLMPWRMLVSQLARLLD